MMDYEKLALEESERIKALLNDCGVTESYINMLLPVIENTSWMKVKLDEAREKIKTSSVVIPYDNGGNQKGIRENPLFKGYHSLFKSYMSGMNVLISFMPKIDAQEVAPVETPKTVLQLVREKREQKA